MKAVESFVSTFESEVNVITKLPDHLPVRSSAAIRDGARNRTPPAKRNIRLSIAISFVKGTELDTNRHTNRRPGWFQVCTESSTDLERPSAQDSAGPRARACNFRNSDR